MIMPTAPLERLRAGLGRRHGIVLAPTRVLRLPADPPGVFHASVPREDGPALASAGGGVGTTPEQAEAAAIAEALERYAANVVEMPTVEWVDAPAEHRLGFDDFTLHSSRQKRDPLLVDVGYGAAPTLTPAWRLADNRPTFVPSALVGLAPTYGALSTSSGLAAAFSPELALLRAAQELIERDAFMGTWLHQLPGREVVDAPLADDLYQLGGWLRAFDLTPAWSPHVVAAVLGVAPLEGHPRFSMGLACRSTWAEAVAKAGLECLQGTVFAGHHLARQPELVGLVPEAVTDFDRHAVFYTACPDRVSALPILAATPWPKPVAVAGGDAATELSDLVRNLAAAGIDLYYRELTTIDLHQIGLRVVRVLAPSLTPIHHDHRLPFLGGTTADRSWRYPDLESLGPFPSPHPHPLG